MPQTGVWGEQVLSDSAGEPKEAQKLHGAELLELLPRLAAAVVTLSLVLGTASLAGKCLGLGRSGFEFLTLSDIGIEALRIAPLAVAGMVASVLYDLAMDTPRVEPRPPRTYVRLFGYSMAAFMLCFWLLPPSVGATLMLALAFVALRGLNGILALRVDAGQLPLWVSISGIVVTFYVIFLIGSYWLVTGRAVATERALTATHEICTQRAVCHSGLLLVRFDATTAFRPLPGNDVVYLANSEIRSIKALAPRQDRAIFPIGELLSWALGALRAPN